MSADLSLLPKDKRQKEELAKKKAQKAMPAPKFEMHLPEERKAEQLEKKKSAQKSWIKFGTADEPIKQKGAFRISKKPTAPVKKVAPPKLKPQPIKQVSTVKKKMLGKKMIGLLGIVIILVAVYFAGSWGIKFYGQEAEQQLENLTFINSQTVLEINTLELR